MAKVFTLEKRTEYVLDPKSGEQRLATDKDKENRYLLGIEGAQIEMSLALKLGLAKAEKAEVKAKAKE